MEKNYCYNYKDYLGKSYWTPSIDLAYARAKNEVHIYENGKHTETLVKQSV
jgi:hypothetical protein